MFVQPRFQSVCGLSSCILPSRVKVKTGISEREVKAILMYSLGSVALQEFITKFSNKVCWLFSFFMKYYTDFMLLFCT